MPVPDQQPASGPGVPGGWPAGRWLPPVVGPEVPGPASPGSAVPDSAVPGCAIPGGPAGPGPAPAPVVPSSAGEAAGMVLAGLTWLARADLASAPAAVQAECLRGLERALSAHAAARANVLRAFTAQCGYEDDGMGSPRTWLTWQTKVTRPAASGALASMRRLGEHPAVAGALADGAVSCSWARQVCEWTDALPGDCRADADVILLAAAKGGADLAGLAELFEEIRRRTARPDRDPGDGFEDRALRLATTLGGAGKLHGDLTPRAAAALQAVLDSLGKKHGPEDTRSPAQRRHDAVEEACLRLLAAGCMPDRAGQPVRLNLNIGLADLLGHAWRQDQPGPGSAGQPDPGHPGQPGSPGQPGPGVPVPAAGPCDDCDAQIAPLVTGRLDHDLLDKLAARLTRPGGPWAQTDPARAGSGCGRPGCGRGTNAGDTTDGGTGSGPGSASARELIARHAVALLSGPSGLAAWLRTGTLPPPAATVSLPLDAGAVTDLIPAHLRRAIITRDRHCAAPGCDTPPAACHIHHIIPRSQGGPTSLANCLLLCSFHHLILIHRHGWTITLHPDGTTTLTSPHGRTLHSHSPPPATAA